MNTKCLGKQGQVNNTYSCKIVFSQEVEIHRNEVKLLEANNAKLEADIR